MAPQTIAHQAPLSVGFSRQEYWSGLPCPPLGDLPDPGIKPALLRSPALQAVSLPSELLPGKPQSKCSTIQNMRKLWCLWVLFLTCFQNLSKSCTLPPFKKQGLANTSQVIGLGQNHWPLGGQTLGGKVHSTGKGFSEEHLLQKVSEDERSHIERPESAPRSWKEPQVNGQERNGDLGPKTAQNRTLTPWAKWA